MNEENAWVIRNLRMYGNSVIPESEVRRYGIRNIEEAIWLGEGIKVRIRKIAGHAERDPVSGDAIAWASKPWYIAEVIN